MKVWRAGLIVVVAAVVFAACGGGGGSDSGPAGGDPFDVNTSDSPSEEPATTPVTDEASEASSTAERGRRLAVDANGFRQALATSPAVVQVAPPDPDDRYGYTVGVSTGDDEAVVVTVFDNTAVLADPELVTEASISGFDLETLTSTGPTWQLPAGMLVTGLYDTGDGVWVLGHDTEVDLVDQRPIALFGTAEQGFTEPAGLASVFEEPALAGVNRVPGWLPGADGGLIVSSEGIDTSDGHRRVFPTGDGSWEHTPVTFDVVEPRVNVYWALSVSDGRQLLAGFVSDPGDDKPSRKGVVFERNDLGVWVPIVVDGVDDGVYLLAELADGSVGGYGWADTGDSGGEPSRFVLGSGEPFGFEALIPPTEDPIDVWSFATQNDTTLLGFGSDASTPAVFVYRTGG